MMPHVVKSLQVMLEKKKHVATVFPATNTITLKQTNPIQENYNHRITLLEANKKSISFYILKMFFKKIIFFIFYFKLFFYF
jgi:hypothetical protein